VTIPKDGAGDLDTAMNKLPVTSEDSILLDTSVNKGKKKRKGQGLTTPAPAVLGAHQNFP
jgi:hypothetical protein